ncbi:hypothetical protein LXA43DRAFT_1021893 [Ganoderma leucocontextum]|nr:hypothetical protein LXA43DRAFT_1021893 [Ganoderma leucocontextum]
MRERVRDGPRATSRWRSWASTGLRSQTCCWGCRYRHAAEVSDACAHQGEHRGRACGIEETDTGGHPEAERCRCIGQGGSVDPAAMGCRPRVPELAGEVCGVVGGTEGVNCVSVSTCRTTWKLDGGLTAVLSKLLHTVPYANDCLEDGANKPISMDSSGQGEPLRHPHPINLRPYIRGPRLHQDNLLRVEGPQSREGLRVR